MNRTFKAVCFTVALTMVAGVSTAFASDEDGVAGGSDAANASLLVSNCLATRSDFISNDVLSLSTTSTAYVPVPGMTKVINQAQTGCVIVTVSSFAFASLNSETQFVRIVLDGNRLCSPIEWQWDGDDGTRARTHGAVCAFGGVAAGNHIVQMQHRSSGGNTVFQHRPSMHIEHR
jgi:hypothetical protein